MPTSFYFGRTSSDVEAGRLRGWILRPRRQGFHIDAGSMSDTHEVTLLLAKWAKGNQQALDDLTPLVYRELRQLAASYLRKERQGHTLQPTALVHEAYVRLVDQSNPVWQSRSHFFGVAARLMRQILVDHARRKNIAPNFLAKLAAAMRSCGGK